MRPRQVEDRYALAAARLLIGQHQQRDRFPLFHDRQRHAVYDATALAIANRTRRKWVACAGALALAAASVTLALGLRAHSSSALVVGHVSRQGTVLLLMDTTQLLSASQTLVPGDVIRYGEGGTASSGSVSGVEVTLAPASQLRIDEVGPTPRFFLMSGGLRARVGELGRGEHVVVETPDSEVEVRGTVFAVEISPPSRSCSASSTIEVAEGMVWVRSGDKQVLLDAGQGWHTPCSKLEVSDEPPSDTADGELAVAPGPTDAPARSTARSSSTSRPAIAPYDGRSEIVVPDADTIVPPVEVSHLAEQNDLFSAAMAAEWRGQYAAALRTLDELISRFPNGPLTESADGERRRILSALR